MKKLSEKIRKGFDMGYCALMKRPHLVYDEIVVVTIIAQRDSNVTVDVPAESRNRDLKIIVEPPMGLGEKKACEHEMVKHFADKNRFSIFYMCCKCGAVTCKNPNDTAV